MVLHPDWRYLSLTPLPIQESDCERLSCTAGYLCRKKCLHQEKPVCPYQRSFGRLRIKKNIIGIKRNIQKDQTNIGINKKLSPETYALINHCAHHFLHNCIPIALIANSDANTNASVSRLLLHICRSVCINVWMYACTHVCMHVCIVNVCMHVFSGCMHVYV